MNPMGMNPMGQGPPGGFNPQMGNYPNMPPFMPNMQPHGFRNRVYFIFLLQSQTHTDNSQNPIILFFSCSFTDSIDKCSFLLIRTKKGKFALYTISSVCWGSSLTQCVCVCRRKSKKTLTEQIPSESD